MLYCHRPAHLGLNACSGNLSRYLGALHTFSSLHSSQQAGDALQQRCVGSFKQCEYKYLLPGASQARHWLYARPGDMPGILLDLFLHAAAPCREHAVRGMH